MVETNSIPNTQDGWGTEEDSNSIPAASKANAAATGAETKGKVMGGGFWGDEPSSTVVTDAGMSH